MEDKYLAPLLEYSLALSNKLSKRPDLYHRIYEPLQIDKLKQELDEKLKNVTSDNEIISQICDFKYKYFINIVIKDLNKLASVKEILKEWSSIADIIIDATYNKLFEHYFNLYTISTCNKGEILECKGCILALGKLGGQELNFSSDVDLLCIYTADYPLGSISTHEFFTKIILHLTKILCTLTEHGFVFRVDHDLRPEGPHGPLVNSLEAIEHYYEIFGQDWERFALLKARPIAGDINLGNLFINKIRPFIFRKSLTINELMGLRNIKEEMMKKFSKYDEIYNIKHCPGGIREIEFFIQNFQQVFGGRIENIRKTNTLETIASLNDNKLIHPNTANILSKAYIFFRKLENLVQIENELQKHSLPAEPKKICFIARNTLGSSDKCNHECHKLLKDFHYQTRLVYKLSSGLYEKNYEKIELNEAIHDNLRKSNSYEEKIDSIVWFKKQEIKRIGSLNVEHKLDIKEVFKKQSILAEVTLETILKIAQESLLSKYGLPVNYLDNKTYFAIIGFGRLGSFEIDYGSDLDISFIYSEDGKTNGPEQITNQEYYTKLAQRIISHLTLGTRYGKAYNIDSDLRPSGKQGVLVTSIESLKDYYSNKADLWEYLALLKAKPIAGEESYLKTVNKIIQEFYKKIEFNNEKLKKEIYLLRNKVKNEIINESSNNINLKNGFGGISDIDMLLQYLKLQNKKIFTSLDWDIKNNFNLIDLLFQKNIFHQPLYNKILESYTFFRTLISNIRFFTSSSIDYINFNASYIDPLLNDFGYKKTKELKDKLLIFRKFNNNLFQQYFKS